MLKNTLFFTVAFGFVMAGCSGDKDGETTGETGTTVGDDDDDTITTPVIVDEIDQSTLADSITCSGTTVSVAVGFFGDASEGMIDSMDTANTPPWNDNHTLDAVGFAATDAVQPFTDLAAGPLTTGVLDWADGESTLFNCTDHWNETVMTHVVRVYDLDGALADCVHWGHDSAGFVAGDYDADILNDLVAPEELAGCTAYTGAN